MTATTLYPGADHTSQWFADDHPGVIAAVVDRLVIHTTEGSSLPTYQGGAVAPNWTAEPVHSNGGWQLRWRQHFPANMSSRALVNAPGGVSTNTFRTTQVELVGTCVRGGPGLYWPAAPLELLAALGQFVAWLHTEWGLPLRVASPWVAPDAPGDSQRMTFAGWRSFSGICGHQHVPENDHRDPGALNAGRVLMFARANPQEDDVAMTPTERAALIADIAEAVTGIHARNPVIVDAGTGADKLPDGRAIDAVPTVLGEMQHEQRLQGQQLTALAAGLQDLVAAVRALAPYGA